MGVCRDAYSYGTERGAFFVRGVEWTKADRDLGRGALCDCSPREECGECVGYAARTAEELDRQVSPFEHHANAYNTARDSEAAWKWYEKGLDAGIRSALAKRLGKRNKRSIVLDWKNRQCADCGKAFDPLPPSGASGYAILGENAGEKEGERVCYPCSDKRERAAFHSVPIGGKFTCYVSSEGKTLTTWPGGRLADVRTEREGRAFGNRVFYYTARGDNASRWIGKGAGRSMFLRVRRVK